MHPASCLMHQVSCIMPHALGITQRRRANKLDHLNHEDDVKNEDNLKNGDNLKDEENLINEDVTNLLKLTLSNF